MNNSKKLILFCTILVALAVGSRLLTIEMSWYNFASLGAIALFSGAMFKNNKMYALLLPLLAVLASDLIIHFTYGFGFYGVSQYFVYASLLLVVLLGTRMKRVKAGSVFGYSIIASLLFFFISNIGTWFAGFFPTAAVPALYPTNFAGLIACIEMGIPFYRNTLISDMLFSGVLFGAYSLYQTLAKQQHTVIA
ncbi:MAG TPA: DUF6580 family putative transport protein [Edaphocola sp.]|nr:DUF6580 family putative transport protein [Edaphocola sp.]